MNLPETLSQGVLIAWTVPVGSNKLKTSTEIISKEKNSEPNFTLWDIAFSFSVIFREQGMS